MHTRLIILTGPVSRIEATNDNSFFYLNIEVGQNLTPGDTVMIAFDTYSGSTGESSLSMGRFLKTDPSSCAVVVAGNDTALHYVTEAYDMYGLTSKIQSLGSLGSEI